MTKKQNRPGKKLVSILSAITLMILVAFQNCGPGFKLAEESDLNNQLASGVFDENCLDNTRFDACLFLKNPTNMKSAPTESAEGDHDISSHQKFGVRLPFIGNQKRELENQHLKVVNMSGVTFSNPSWRIPASAENEELLAAAMSFYWGHRALQKIIDTNVIDLTNFHVLLVVNAPMTGFAADENAIFLQTRSENRPNAAFDASVISHLMTEAVISHVTAKSIYAWEQSTTHMDCGPLEGPVYSKDCCSSSAGCSKALTAGLADFLSASLFSAAPAVGDYLSGSPGGINLCGISRNPAVNTSLSATLAFDHCRGTGRQGQIYNMGTLLSSTLASVRGTLDASQIEKFDAFVIATLPYLSAADDFTSWKLKAEKIDTDRFDSSFSAALNAEFKRRGF